MRHNIVLDLKKGKMNDHSKAESDISIIFFDSTYGRADKPQFPEFGLF